MSDEESIRHEGYDTGRVRCRCGQYLKVAPNDFKLHHSECQYKTLKLPRPCERCQKPFEAGLFSVESFCPDCRVCDTRCRWCKKRVYGSLRDIGERRFYHARCWENYQRHLKVKQHHQEARSDKQRFHRRLLKEAEPEMRRLQAEWEEGHWDRQEKYRAYTYALATCTSRASYHVGRLHKELATATLEEEPAIRQELAYWTLALNSLRARRAGLPKISFGPHDRFAAWCNSWRKDWRERRAPTPRRVRHFSSVVTRQEDYARKKELERFKEQRKREKTRQARTQGRRRRLE